MNCDLLKAPNCDIIKAPVVFHSRKHSLHGYSLIEYQFPLRCLLCKPFLVRLRCFDNGLPCPMSFNNSSELSTTIPCVTNYIFGVKFAKWQNINKISVKISLKIYSLTVKTGGYTMTFRHQKNLDFSGA